MSDFQQSLMTGRPPVIQREYIDCKFPTPTAAPDDEDGSEEREAACAFYAFTLSLALWLTIAPDPLTSRDMGFPFRVELCGRSCLQDAHR